HIVSRRLYVSRRLPQSRGNEFTRQPSRAEERRRMAEATHPRAAARPAEGNRSGGETSPYLLQHRDNPVAWRPWGESAFAEARAEDKPLLLSVGYAACHWCHVMAHESFENAEIAEAMNRLFVNIKVDREER